MVARPFRPIQLEKSRRLEIASKGWGASDTGTSSEPVAGLGLWIAPAERSDDGAFSPAGVWAYSTCLPSRSGVASDLPPQSKIRPRDAFTNSESDIGLTIWYGLPVTLLQQKGFGMRWHRLCAVVVLFLGLSAPGRAEDMVRITEFMALNDGPLVDEDGEFSDWIEIHNGGTNSVNLDGWILTDRVAPSNPWRFPNTNLPPNAYLLVFASGKDRRVPGAPLHTDFRLGGNGEYLALIKPDGTNVATAFSPAYPAQVSGVSYGIPLQQTTTTLIGSGATAKVLVPLDDSEGSAWTMASFDDSGWVDLTTGVGYETDGRVPFVPFALANSVTEFSGVQGQASWSYGYWNRSSDADGVFSATDFTAFPNSGGGFGPNNYWTGTVWDWFNGDPPYTQLTSQGGRPTAGNGNAGLPEHVAIRRYVSEFDGPLRITGRLTHTSDWVYVVQPGIATSSLLYIYLAGLGEGYLDDIKLVAGLVAEQGPNLIANGDFENPALPPNWTVSPNLAASSVTTTVRHGGARSLRMVSTAGGSTQTNAIWQNVAGLTANQIYTLSYWYLPSTNSSPLTIRFSGGWINTTPEYCGDGALARIFVDGTEVFEQQAFVSSSDFALTVPARLGSKVDFAIDPGPSGNDLCDSTVFTASIQTSDPTVSLVADSAADWSVSGTQGEKNWFYGYFYGGTNAAVPTYRTTNFVAFPRDNGPHSTNNFWDGASWDWFNGDPPFTEIGQFVMNPNGINAVFQHWAIRRWVSEVSGAITVDWTVTKLEATGAGVTARVFHNGAQRDVVTLPGPTSTPLSRSTVINGVQVGDFIDLVIDPMGTGGAFGDGGDRSFVSAVIRGTPSLTAQIASSLEDGMLDFNASAFIRVPFNVSDPSAIQFLTLRMKFDDGFAAYLNGQLVASANAPALPAWNSAATMSRSDADASEFQEFNLTPLRGLLQPGANVLAIHGLNASASDSDFLILPELIAASIALDPSLRRYFSPPTPGAANGFGSTNIGPIIASATHAPSVPKDNEILAITATVQPTVYPLGQVRLIYRVMYSNEVNVAMFDDGAHGDGAAGDGTYGATIPANASQPGQMVRYYVFASDSLNNSSRFPLFDNPQDSPQYQGTVVFDSSLTNPLPVLHFFVQNPVLATNYTGTRGSLFYEDEFYDNIGVNLHGQTTAAVFSKRSMDIDMNRGYRFRWSRAEERVNDFNLLTTAADKAYLRLSLAFETFNNAGVPTHFAFPVRVQQNGALYGVMHFVEKGDDNYLARVGLNPNGALYKIYLPLTNAYGGVAEKKTRQGEDNSDLQELIDGLNLSGAARRQFLFDNVDIPEVINFLAAIQLVQNEDCCWYKNYYLYRDSERTGEWKMLPWDLDLTFGRTFTAWCGDGDCTGEPVIFGGYYDTNIFWTNRYYTQMRSSSDYIGIAQPLGTAILTTPDTFDMFMRRWTTVQEELLQTNNTHPLLLKFERRIDELAEQIAPDAVPDLAKWGTFAPVQSLPTAVEALKTEYFGRRRGWVFNTLRYANGGPYLGPQSTNVNINIGSIEFNPSSGNQDQEYIQLVNSTTNSVDISGWRITGAIDYTFRPGVVIPSNSVLYLSPNVNAFRARTTGPRGGQGLFVQGNYDRRLSARGELLQLTDKGGRVVRTTNYVGNPSLAQRYLRITEIMYHPPPSPPGVAASAEEFEYVELKNTGPLTMNLLGVRFANGIEFNFTGSSVTSLAAGQSVLIVKNLAAFTSRYGGGFNVAGQYTGALENGGENIRLEDATGEKVLDFNYDNNWYPITDGDGFSLVIVNESAAWDTWGLPASWRPSGSERGSPGQTETAPAVIAAIRVNEVLSRTVPPAVDAVELYNPTAGPVNLRGWFLSDDFGTPKKFRVSTDVIVPPGGYVVFDESHFNTPSNAPTSFAFSSLGDEVYLFSGDANTNLTGYVHGFGFGATENGVSFGRYITSVGEEHFVAQTTTTLGATNGPPKIGPVVISEIMFRPPDLLDGEDNGLDEFIELHNNTGASVALFDPAQPANTWLLENAVAFSFPTNITLAANGYLLVVNFDPADASLLAAFRNRYGVPAQVSVFGPYTGKLDNSAESVELYKPDAPGLSGVPYVLVDRIEYQDIAPWPGGADGTQASLQRRSSLQYGNDPINWAAAAPTAGRAFGGGTAPVITSQPANHTVVAFSDAIFTVGATGSALRYQWRVNGVNDPTGTNATLIIPNVQPLQTAVVDVTVFNSAGTVTSSNATFTVLLPAFITRHPTNFMVRVAPDPLAAPSPTASFNVAAVSTTPVRYQWQFNGVNIPNATNVTLTLTNVQISNEGPYTAMVTDGVGPVISRPGQLIPLVTPTAVVSPVSQAVAVGQPVTLSVSFNGYPLPFTFEWRQGSVIIATNILFSRTDFLTFTAPATPRTNQYRAIVRNLASPPSGVTSVPALVAILADTDGDGIPDVSEPVYGEHDLDGDGDGMLNGQEYIAGTDPANAASYLRIDSLNAGAGATLTFGAISNRTYSVQYIDDLGSTAWFKLTHVPARASNRVETLVDPGFSTNRAYRLVTPRQP